MGTQTRTAEGEARAKTALHVVLLTVFVDLVGFSIIFPLLPEMLAHYLGAEGDAGLLGQLVALLRAAAGASGAQADLYTQVLFGGVLGSVYSLLQFVAAPLWGALSDRIGRRRVLVVTIAGTALSYVLWVFAGTFALLLGARVLGGLMSGNISVATAAVADITDTRQRTQAMGMLGASFAMGFIIGPAIGGGLSAVDLSASVDLPGINPFSAPALAAFALSLWNLVWVARRFGETLPPGRIARAGRPANPLSLTRGTAVPGVDRINVIYLVFITAFAGMEFTLTFLARDRFAYDSVDNVWIFLFVGLVIAGVQGGLVRRLAPKYGERRLALTGFALVAMGLGVIGAAGSELALYFGLAYLAAGTALATPSLTSLVSLYAPSHRQGEFLGVFRSFGSFGRAVGPLLACVIYWRLGSTWPYAGAAAIMLIPFYLGLRLPPPRR